MQASLITRAVAARLAARLREEVANVSRVVDLISGTLARLPAEPTPDVVSVHGTGGLLHDFYTGIEKLFETIGPELNGDLPSGETWHRELLHTMTLELAGIRPAMISERSEVWLLEYLKFRHLYRHMYGFRLRWDRVRELAEGVPPFWPSLLDELRAFVSFLDAVASAES